MGKTFSNITTKRLRIYGQKDHTWNKSLTHLLTLQYIKNVRITHFTQLNNMLVCDKLRKCSTGIGMQFLKKNNSVLVYMVNLLHQQCPNMRIRHSRKHGADLDNWLFCVSSQRCLSCTCRRSIWIHRMSYCSARYGTWSNISQILMRKEAVVC